MLSLFEQYELFWRHDGPLEVPDHLDNLGIVFEFGVEVRTVIVEDLHQLSFNGKVFNKLLE